MTDLRINFYPFSDPIILTDDLFKAYGGNEANTTNEQRQACYWLAEQKATSDIGTLLTPAIVTGTHSYSEKILLDYGYVDYLTLLRFIDFEEDIYYTVSGTANIYVSLWDAKRGIIDIGYALRNCHCITPTRPYPYMVQAIYHCGLPSGTVYRPDVLLGLTTYAQIMLNEIVGWGNEAPGDIGIEEYRNQQYSERRMGLLNTVYGSSPKANFAHKMMSRLRQYRQVGL